jgi:hypothetical protein
MKWILASVLLASPAMANDGFGGFSATGLTFGQTDQVAMETEDLVISPDRIAVDYTFRNLGAKDVTGEVIFPLPPIPVGDLMNSMWNLPDDYDRPNLLDFKAVVDGAPVPVTIDRVAVVQPEGWWDLSTAEQSDTPGRDVTALLAAHGVNLSLDFEKIYQDLNALAPADRDALLAEGAIGDYDDSDAFDLYPNWSIILRYHWTQTFKAGAVTKVHHDYENRPTGGVFGWEDPPQDDYMKEVAATYCVDDGTSKAIAKALSATMEASDGAAWGMGYNIEYVLRTANSWAGPIQKFTLTLDKGDPKNVISLCADGLKKTGETTFVVEKTDYTPTEDLKILLVQPGGE